jgi:hypothetical protein
MPVEAHASLLACLVDGLVASEVGRRDAEDRQQQEAEDGGQGAAHEAQRLLQRGDDSGAIDQGDDRPVRAREAHGEHHAPLHRAKQYLLGRLTRGALEHCHERIAERLLQIAQRQGVSPGPIEPVAGAVHDQSAALSVDDKLRIAGGRGKPRRLAQQRSDRQVDPHHAEQRAVAPHGRDDRPVPERRARCPLCPQPARARARVLLAPHRCEPPFW